MVLFPDVQSYAIFVAVLALIYSVFSRVIQQKFGNQKDMKEFQDNSKRLQKEFDEASKANNKSRMDEIMQKQMANFSIMNRALVGQFKIMGLILVTFFGFMFIANMFDPSVADDFTVKLVDTGASCDEIAGDGVFSACIKPDYSAASGPWLAHITSRNGGETLQENYAWFSYSKKNGEGFFNKPPEDRALNASFASGFVPRDGTAYLFAKPTKGTDVSVEAKLNSGTWFYIDLPFTIPIINVQRLNDPQGWFIFVSIIFGILTSLVLGQWNKLQAKLQPNQAQAEQTKQGGTAEVSK